MSSEAVFKLEPAFDKAVDLEIEGWEKLRVKYSTESFSGVSYLSWRVDGTEHVFRIPVQIVYEHHRLDYPAHFRKTLETFREDYVKWEKEEFPEEWMKRYQRMFTHLIKP